MSTPQNQPHIPTLTTEQITELKARDTSKRRIGAAYASVFIMMFVAVVLTIPVVMFNLLSLSSALLMTVLAEIVAVAMGVSIIKEGSNWKQALRLHKFTWKSFGIGASIGIVLFILLQACAIGLNAIVPEDQGVGSSETSEMLASASGVELYIIMLLVVPFIVPFVEELFFRGYVFGFLKDSRAPLWSAFLVSSVYFALLHSQGFSTFGDTFIVLWTGGIAFVHALLVHKYDSIWPAVASHILYNLVTCLIALMQMSA